MTRRCGHNVSGSANRGMVLLLTLVLLVILATVSYALTSKLAAFRHRQSYMISYQSARYACDSAVKYALSTMGEISPELASRPNEPDFSDVFWMSDEEYHSVLEQWAEQMELEPVEKPETLELEEEFEDVNDGNDLMDFNDVNSADEDSVWSFLDQFGVGGKSGDAFDANDPNKLVIPGPYGAEWPFVSEPVEFEIGKARVRITIEDENAKYPAGWAMLEDNEFKREAEAGFETFCEWMDVNSEDIELLKDQLAEMNEIRPFKLKLAPIKIKVTERYEAKPTRGSSRRRRYARPKTKMVEIPVSQQLGDEAKMMNSSLFDTEILARNTVVSDERKESALKYMNIWGGRTVNINTAPRQVLEAVFTFGGDGPEIAEEIIRRRQDEPFKSVDKLREALFGYSDSINKCKEFITTESDMFSIRVTATSGSARASTLIAVRLGNKADAKTQASKQTDDKSNQQGGKVSKQVEVIAMISG